MPGPRAQAGGRLLSRGCEPHAHLRVCPPGDPAGRPRLGFVGCYLGTADALPVGDPRGREREVTQRVAGLSLRREQPGEAGAGAAAPRGRHRRPRPAFPSVQQRDQLRLHYSMVLITRSDDPMFQFQPGAR